MGKNIVNQQEYSRGNFEIDSVSNEDMSRGVGHIHSLVWCSMGWTVSDRKIINNIKAAAENNMDFLIFTDHNSVKPFERLRNNEKLTSKLEKEGFYVSSTDNCVSLARDNDVIDVYRGVENSTNKGHVLGWFVPEDYSKKKDIVDFGNYVSDSEGMVVAAHPFAFGSIGKKGLDILLENELLDAVEYNSTAGDKANGKALEYANNNNVPIVSSPDLHLSRDIRDGYFEISKEFYEKNRGEGFGDALKKYVRDGGDIEIFTGKTNVLTSSALRFAEQMRYFVDYR